MATEQKTFRLLAQGTDPSYECIEIDVTLNLFEMESIEGLKEKNFTKYESQTEDFYKNNVPSSIVVIINEIDLNGYKEKLKEINTSISHYDVPEDSYYINIIKKIEERISGYYYKGNEIDDENEFINCCAFLKEITRTLRDEEKQLINLANLYFTVA